MSRASDEVPEIADLPTISLASHRIARIDLEGVLHALFVAMSRKKGGWLMTLNIDLAYQGHANPEIASIQKEASLIVADGMPLIWASRLQGNPLPERIAGSDLVFHLAERCAAEGRCLYLLGGAPGAAEGAAFALEENWPELTIAGFDDPELDSKPSASQLASIGKSLRAASPDLVLVAFGSPKTEHLISQLRREFPEVWWVGVGIGLGFAAGQARRAPQWMQRIGAEWLHRLSQEPGRLARRYLLHDLPFALMLMVKALLKRIRSSFS